MWRSEKVRMTIDEAVISFGNRPALTRLAFLKHLVLKHRWLPLMPSATYFFLTAKKSRQKMPLSNAEGLAQRKSLL